MWSPGFTFGFSSLFLCSFKGSNPKVPQPLSQSGNVVGFVYSIANAKAWPVDSGNISSIFVLINSVSMSNS